LANGFFGTLKERDFREPVVEAKASDDGKYHAIRVTVIGPEDQKALKEISNFVDSLTRANRREVVVQSGRS
jgi:hypothetical protein